MWWIVGYITTGWNSQTTLKAMVANKHFHSFSQQRSGLVNEEKKKKKSCLQHTVGGKIRPPPINKILSVILRHNKGESLHCWCWKSSVSRTAWPSQCTPAWFKFVRNRAKGSVWSGTDRSGAVKNEYNRSQAHHRARHADKARPITARHDGGGLAKVGMDSAGWLEEAGGATWGHTSTGLQPEAEGVDHYYFINFWYKIGKMLIKMPQISFNSPIIWFIIDQNSIFRWTAFKE